MSLNIVNLELKISSYQADHDSVKIISKKLILFDLGVVHILRNQPRGGGFQMLMVDYGGGGGLVVDYVIKILIFYQFS